jgi:acid phosphatase
LLVAALASGCATPVEQAARVKAPEGAAPGQPAITWHGTTQPHPTKVLVVVEENHTQRDALRGMPFLASLARPHGYTTAYRAVAHPSLPNYLAIAGGSTFGVRDDRSPASHHISGPSVFDRVIASGRTAKTYAESMPAPCSLAPAGRYAVKHNPWAYFSDARSRANCRRYDVPAGTPQAGALREDIDAGRLPHVGMLIPDICSDGHDCSLATADSWLKGWLGRVMVGPDYRAGRLAVVVTFDEDDGSSGNVVLTTVISPYTSHVVSPTPYTHYSLARYLGEVTGTAPLGAAASAPSLRSAFRI